jgi:hypothetical protein
VAGFHSGDHRRHGKGQAARHGSERRKPAADPRDSIRSRGRWLIWNAQPRRRGNRAAERRCDGSTHRAGRQDEDECSRSSQASPVLTSLSRRAAAEADLSEALAKADSLDSQAAPVNKTKVVPMPKRTRACSRRPAAEDLIPLKATGTYGKILGRQHASRVHSASRCRSEPRRVQRVW